MTKPFLAALLFLLFTGGTTSAQYPDWKHSGSIWLLTTPEGAELPAEAAVADFPLLVRLHQDFFDFRQAQPNGEDVRFSSSKGERLPYQIEEWDAVKGVASIWVKVPQILGNSRQELKLNWGNASASSESSGPAVFSTTNGYVSVWHLTDPVQDEVGTLKSTDTGTTPIAGIIGAARHFPGGKGIAGGEKIPNYPTGASSHSTEAWFRIEKPNATIIGWGNEGGGRGSKVRMQFRSPPHLHIDSDFSDVNGEGRLSLGEWIHVAHTYDNGAGKIYINGKLDGAAKPVLDIKRPARLWLGGWYNQYDFVGDLDEVRVSQVARSADWIKLQYENQKLQQTLVGPVVQTGSDFSVFQVKVTVAEGKSATITAKAGGAQKIYWILKQNGKSSIVATDRLSFSFEAPRVTGNQTQSLQFQAIYASEVKTTEIALTISDSIPEPQFTLAAPATWDGRETVEVVPQITNLAALQAAGAGELNFRWTLDDVAVTKQVVPGKLILKRAQGTGPLRVSVSIDNGGGPTIQTKTIEIKKSPASQDAWVMRPSASAERPEDNQFIPRDKEQGTLVYSGTLAEAAEAVFVRVFADDKLFATQNAKLTAEKTYALTVKLKPGLVKYRTEFGFKIGEKEKVLHQAANIVCGDVYLIDGQSNAVATDFGKEDPTVSSDWIRTFGSTAGDSQNSRAKLWGNAVARSREAGKLEIGYWGMELGKRLVESQKIPVCLINGAVGGSRIDQHQRNASDPTDVETIYGRLLWRVQQAKLTHGVRAVLWHQGENDQGADGPTGGYGFETYRPYFVEMSAAWKEDYPNIQQYYMFQIWPKSCAMGINGSDNKLREVQRTLPRLFSNLSILPTLGVKPPGGCHFPKEGYAEFARLLSPLLEAQIYEHNPGTKFQAPNLIKAFYSSTKQDELVLEFDSPVVWEERLASQFHLPGEPQQVVSGLATGKTLRLKLKGPSQATQVTYLDSASWSPDNLLYGENGLAALTFCEVPILPHQP